MVSERVTDLGVEDVLDAMETWHAERTERDVAIFVAAAHLADLHHPDSRRAGSGRVLPGSERGVRLGGPGTPLVLEFAPAELAARTGKSPAPGGRSSPTRWTPGTGSPVCGPGCARVRSSSATRGMWPSRPAS